MDRKPGPKSEMAQCFPVVCIFLIQYLSFKSDTIVLSKISCDDETSKLEKARRNANLCQAAILNFNHVTIRFEIRHFLMVVHWNRASIPNSFRDIRPNTC